MSNGDVDERAQSAEEEQERMRQLLALVVQELKSGADKFVVTQNLVAQGMEEAPARALVDQIHDRVTQFAETEQWTVGSLVPAILGGVIAAIMGGGIWGFIVSSTDYEIGFMAWGVGLLAGFAVLLFAGGRRGVPFQLIAVVSSVAGILIGKYLTFYFILKTHVAEEYGAEKAEQLSMFSSRVVEFFGESLPNIVGGYDLLWVGLALITAWRVPKGSGIKLG